MNNIKDLIYIIRDKQVMLDSDVAMLYNYETKYIVQTIKRNIDRFPEDFCYQLTKEEYENNLRSQFVTSSLENSYGGRRYLPYVLTEQGIAMLSGLLKNDIAVKVSVNIMRNFVEMRKFISNNMHMFDRITNVEYRLLEHDHKFNELFDYFQDEELKEKIFYEGQIYDSYSLIIDIIKKANKNIVIIDNYIDKSILDLLSNKNIDVVVKVITRNGLSDLDIYKFNEQYPTLTVNYNNSYHDRFIIIDDTIYHLGASLKDLGKRTFAITIMEDKTLLDRVSTPNLQ